LKEACALIENKQWCNERISQTKMDNLFHVLGGLCGDRCRHAVVLNITVQQQQAYFKPASQLAQNGAMAKQLFEDEAKDAYGIRRTERRNT